MIFQILFQTIIFWSGPNFDPCPFSKTQCSKMTIYTCAVLSKDQPEPTSVFSIDPAALPPPSQRDSDRTKLCVRPLKTFQVNHLSARQVCRVENISRLLPGHQCDSTEGYSTSYGILRGKPRNGIPGYPAISMAWTWTIMRSGATSIFSEKCTFDII